MVRWASHGAVEGAGWGVTRIRNACYAAGNAHYSQHTPAHGVAS